MIPDAQRAVYDFLSRPDAYDQRPERVERIDTHVSAVFIAGAKVYKMKRAVTLAFLDFATLEQRRVACLAEVALNRRTAPDLCRGVATVNRDAAGRLSIGGEGEVVEWLVVMNAFDRAQMLGAMAADGRLDRQIMQDLAEAVAELHRKAEKRPANGGRAGIGWVIENNVLAFAPHAAILDPGRVAALTERSRLRLEAVGELLERRREDGFVRQCHGDLHLDNICMWQGRPTPFDAIEFSDAIACVDVWYDLAFLLMDLDRRGLRLWASVVMNHYFALTGDAGALEALPLFLSLRAAVRSHVAAACVASLPEPARDEKIAEARDFLDRALAYLDPPKPRLVAVGGLSGSGKSRLGRDVAPELGAAPGALVVRSDVLRKRLVGVGLHTRLDAAGYSAEMTERTFAALYETCAQALAAGHSVVADAVFARPEQREAIEAVARRAGVPFDGLWLEADAAALADRVAKRKGNVSDATVDVLQKQLTYDLGTITWKRVDSSGSKADTLSNAREALGV